MKYSGFYYFAVAATILLLSSCKKVEGQGGTSSIRGKIYVKNYNGAGNLIGEYDGAKEDVYIIYGDGDNIVDDKVEASYDGTFEFKYLEEGNYTIFVYQDCPTCDSGEEALKVTATISGKKSTVDLGTIEIKK